MVSLSELKKNSTRNLDRIRKQAKSEESGGRSSNDDRFWRLERNKDGSAVAVIRFLPIPQVDSEKDEALEWVKMFSHGFQNKETGRWYIENSLTTVGKQDAIGELNRALWASGSEADKEQARQQKRKLQYISNIYVVKDPNNPENEGKVFLFKYGKKIHTKITDQMLPPEGLDEEPVDPFNFWEGKNFKLYIQTVDGWPNYDKSTWQDSAPISDKNGNELSDEEIEKVYESEYSLLQFIDPENTELFKSPEYLQERLNTALGLTSEETKQAPARKEEKKKSSPLDKPAKKEEKKPAKKEEESSDEDDIDIDSLIDGLEDD